MNTIELYHGDRSIFLEYLGTHLDTQTDHDIRSYNLSIDNENKGVIKPSFGEFHWRHGDETFLIQFYEEGSPVEGCVGPTYFQRLKVQHHDIRALESFVTSALTYVKPMDVHRIQIYHSKSRGYWEKLNTVYAQPIESIYLEESVVNNIVNQIEAFSKSRDRYIRYGRSYKLNYLLAGVPGSGKSSLVKSIAMKYKRPLYIMSLSKALTDDLMADLVADLKDNAIVLFEDIDAFFQDRKAVDINISFSCLINVLDGTLCKGNGVITFLTANNPEHLDPALIRPGRVDHIIRFDYPKRSQIEAAFKDLTGNADAAVFEEFYRRIKNTRINMSGIVDLLFRHPEDYMSHIDELLNSTQFLQEIINDKTDKMYC
jgi:adenylate kinase family enzyme